VSEMGAKAAGCGLTEAERESNSETTHREPKNAQKFTKHQSNPSPNVVCVVPATINTDLLLFGKPLVLTKLAQHPSLPCALLRIFSYLNPFSELLSLFPSLSAFVTIPLSLSFCHYSPLSLSFSLSRNAGRRVADSMRKWKKTVSQSRKID